MYFAGYVNEENQGFDRFEGVNLRFGQAAKKAAYRSWREGSRTAVISIDRFMSGAPASMVFDSGKAIDGSTFSAYTIDGSNVTSVIGMRIEESSEIISSSSLQDVIDFCVGSKYHVIKLGYNGHMIDVINIEELIQDEHTT